MNKAIIFHHDDMDGLFSGAIIFDSIKNKFNDIRFVEVDYTVDIDISGITDDTVVYFVDYSFSSPSNINKLYTLVKDIKCKIIWIDHHKSSVDFIKDNINTLNDTNFKYYINTNYCGALLCYYYANNILCEGVSGSILPLLNVPSYLKVVDSWDTWKHTVEFDKEFMYGFMALELTPNEIIDYINLYNTDKEFINACIDIGSNICKYLNVDNKALCRKQGFRFTISLCGSEYNCFAVNAKGNSTIFGELINEYDIVCSFIFNGKQFVYSLFTNSNDIDCAKLAKILGEYNGLGGGGHKQAAGFQTIENILSNKCEIKVTNKLFNKNKYNIKVI